MVQGSSSRVRLLGKVDRAVCRSDGPREVRQLQLGGHALGTFPCLIGYVCSVITLTSVTLRSVAVLLVVQSMGYSQLCVLMRCQVMWALLVQVARPVKAGNPPPCSPPTLPPAPLGSAHPEIYIPQTEGQAHLSS